jgi:hypothetical protein
MVTILPSSICNPRPGRPHLGSRPARQLAARRRFAPEGLADFIEVDIHYVVEEESRSFERRETLERQHQRQSDVVDLLVVHFDDRFRQPRANIGLTLIARRCTQPRC